MTHPGPTEVYHAGSASFRKLNAHLLQPTGPIKGDPSDIDKFCGILADVPDDPYQVPTSPYETPRAKRLRQKSGDGLNKTERAFFEHLKAAYPNAEHYPQAWSFRLANGANYRPDFVTIWSHPFRVTAWETKGFKREASAVRIKVAAAKYPAIKFMLVTKRRKKDGAGWDFEEVLK